MDQGYAGCGLPRTQQRVEKLASGRLDLRRWLLARRPLAKEAGAGGRSAAACARCLGPLPQKASSRFMFCPAAINIASMFTRLSVLSRNLLIPCHSLASANMGSTHTLRLRKAFR